MSLDDKTFRTDELFLSQLPALQLLVQMGFTYLTPAEALAARGGRQSNVLLEEILRAQLKKQNRIQFKGEAHLFSEENIQSGIQRLKSVKYDGLVRTNEAIYDLLTLGSALEQTLEGVQRSFTLNYIDWRNPLQNAFHVTAEFPVERSKSYETARPDIVAFVNGIPFLVIECKAPREEVKEAVSQTIRNQRDEYIPKLFTYAQMVMGVNKNEARYGTIGTPAKFWGAWQEEIDDTALAQLIGLPVSEAVRASLFDLVAKELGAQQDISPYTSGRTITPQDRALYALCRPERLLDLAWRFTVFDGGVRKIARYQQYFAVQKVLNWVQDKDADGRRRGGVVWHTQGSGKSLTMVMLARALALDARLTNARVVLVTDRVDLDIQLGNTFAACGLSPERAESGRHLLKLVSEEKAHIITTLIHKFDKALSARKFQEPSADIFMLVDEGHRTNFGSFAARMRQMFPRACYLGFTGTPLLSEEKNNFRKFGGLIDSYSISQAVRDGAVVPLLYEARHVEMQQNKQAIDTWFERHTQGLSDAQKADLKKKYSRAETLNKADQVIYMRAFDISEHFRANWQGTGYKAQLVAPSKAAALKYRKYLDELGYVSSEIIMSPPDEREGFEETDEPESNDAVVAFWQRMMARYGSEEEYNKQITNQFKNGESPEILIVISKLITGFDAPRNTVLYLARTLTQHTLLQAIARVNRLYDVDDGSLPKEYGYIIDYAGVLGELDRAMSQYEALAGFDDGDLMGAIQPLAAEVAQLPQRHAELWALFAEVKNAQDEEAYEQWLADLARREEFYDRLNAYARTLALALASEQWMASVDDRRLNQYKADLRRFQSLKVAVRLRYAESVDYKQYEAKIQKLLDTHISATEVMQLHAPVNIFDEAAFAKVVEEQGHRKSAAAKADMIAHATKRAITERLQQDPAFYTKFSQLIQQAIDDYRARRISEIEYLQRVGDYKDAVVKRRSDDVPTSIKDKPDVAAVFGVVKPIIGAHVSDGATADTFAAEVAERVWSIVQANRIVDYWQNADAQKRTVNAIDDYLYDEVRGKHGVELTTDEMDDLIARTMRVAQARMSN
ncbi:MAG: type I restriction endonuclease subunit R [Rhodocyclaceae bacterium]|nr:type I restriction endonuclease subunit R [Rhodocyclaceae bacterium]MCA3030065.1 type I restriction endonuclease subunit R [Rhodocyclaceae bacterium]MCA3059894.1 type I restriction endonuclease subunit R [Rhodocyclaceae bacterium]MCA3081255.1 type I restriction endonuclease subunit R [Rhodocyclaceae bacterium]